MLLQSVKNNPKKVLEVFLISNLAFLALDIWIAHLYNDFAHRAEWIPLAYSIVGTCILVITALMTKLSPLNNPNQAAGKLVGYAGIFLGIIGMYFHLESQFFKANTINSIIYTAPFVAPLAFSGVGFLLILNRQHSLADDEWSRWILFLTLGGFTGNFLLSLLDHAQNNFFHFTEWIPVIGSAIAMGFLCVSVKRGLPGSFYRLLNLIMLIQIIIGVAGFYFHFMTNVNGPAEEWTRNFIWGTPTFAPLLFTNLGILGLLGSSLKVDAP